MGRPPQCHCHCVEPSSSSSGGSSSGSASSSGPSSSGPSSSGSVSSSSGSASSELGLILCAECPDGLIECFELVVPDPGWQCGFPPVPTNTGWHGIFTLISAVAGAGMVCESETDIFRAVVSVSFPGGGTSCVYNDNCTWNLVLNANPVRLIGGQSGGTVHRYDCSTTFDCTGTNTFNRVSSIFGTAMPATLTIEPIACL